QARGIPDSQIGLRRRAKVVKGLQKPETRLRHQCSPVISHSSNGFRHPGWIAGEKLIVLGRAQKTYNSQFDHEIIDDFLGLTFGKHVRSQIAREVYIEECGYASQRHCRAI